MAYVFSPLLYVICNMANLRASGGPEESCDHSRAKAAVSLQEASVQITENNHSMIKVRLESKYSF